MSPYIDRFPEDYRRLVLDPEYRPNLSRLIGDYLEHNPTRNRPLDMLPVFATHDLERVKAAVEEPNLVRPRPTFHFRLPNSMIDDPGWSIALEWNRWAQIERLAASRERLDAMCHDYLRVLDEPLSLRRETWLKRSARWIEHCALA